MVQKGPFNVAIVPTFRFNKLLPTLHVPYQSGASSSPSSSPSSDPDPGLVGDISHGIFHSHHKTFLFSIFPSIAIYLLLRLMSWNLTTLCLAVTGGGSVGECGRLSQLS